MFKAFKIACYASAVVGWLLYPVSLAFAETENGSRLERSLIEILQSDAPKQEKALTCKRLAVHGTKHAVDALEPLLADPQLASWARIALEAIPDRAAGEALQRMLPQVDGRLCVGVIHSIGVRRDADAVEVLADALQGVDAETASAAAVALGQIAGPAATEVLENALATAPEAVRSAVAEGCVLCAEQLLRLGAADLATDLYDKVRRADVPQQRVIEATRGAILARGDAGIPLLVEQLQSSDKLMFYLGLQTTREMPGVPVTEVLVQQLEQTSPERKPKLIYALADRRDAAVQLAVLDIAANGTHQAARVTAVQVLGRVGDASCIPVLVEISGEANQELTGAVQSALQEVPGNDVDAEIAARLSGAEGTARLVLINAVGARRIAAVPELRKSADDADTQIRHAALAALGQTVGPNDLSFLIERVATIQGNQSKDGSVARGALQAACVRMPDGDACVRQLVSAMSGSSVQAQSALLEIIGSVGGAEALQAMSDSALGRQAELQDTASRLLGEWMTTDAAPVLLKLAQSDVPGKFRTRGLRGYLRIVRQFPFPDADRVEMCHHALQAAERDAERALIVQVLQRYPSLESLGLAAEMAKIESQQEAATLACLTIAQKIGTDSEPVRSLLNQVGHPPARIEIVKAEYGAVGKVADVTAILAECAHDLRLLVLPEKKNTYNDAFGDPAPGAAKQLNVHYRINGELAKASFDENAIIVLPLP